jgi:hypothetical protein
VNSLHKPGDFPVGSLESRAAARMQLVCGRKRLRIIWSIPPREADISRVHFGEWQEWPDGTLGQQVYLPHVWAKPGDAVPRCPDCGTPFRKTREYPGMVGFLADCMDKHDPTPQFDCG